MIFIFGGPLLLAFAFFVFTRPNRAIGGEFRSSMRIRRLQV
jgi:hypothetical protein